MAVLVTLITSSIIFLWPPLFRALLIPTEIQGEVSKDNRIVFFDFIRGVAILGVILIHVVLVIIDSHPGWINFGYTASAASRFAIGFFLIASGALLSSEYSWGMKFWKPKLIRIFIPYTLAVLLLMYFGGHKPHEFLYLLISGKADVPYYFISILFQLYLCYFILNPFRNARWFLPLTFIISMFAFFVVRTPEIYGIPLAGRYLFFFAYGIAHSDRLKKLQPIPHAIPLMLVVITYLLLVGIYRTEYNNEQFIYAPAMLELLIIAHSRSYISPWILRSVSQIGRISLWIFLIHIPIVQLVVNKSFEYDITSIVLCFVSASLISVGISTLCEYIYSKISNTRF